MIGWPGPIGVAKIETCALDIFDFAEAGSTMAFLAPIYSGGRDSKIIDLIAWNPSDPTRWFTRRYSGGAMGDDQLLAAEFWNEPIFQDVVGVDVVNHVLVHIGTRVC